MLIASRACLPRIGTRRLRPHAPRAAQSHALCKPAGTAAGHGAATGRLFESPSPPHRSTIRSGGHPGILGEQLGGSGGHTVATRGSKAAAHSKTTKIVTKLVTNTKVSNLLLR